MMGHKIGATMKIFLLSFLFSINLFADQLNWGDVVIDSANQVGVVQRVYNNGKVVVKINGSEVVRMQSDLSLQVPCYQKFCSGYIVADRPHYGVVSAVFANGKVQYTSKLDSYVKYQEAEKLGLAFSCIKDACIGNLVIDKANMEGKIVYVFDNDYALINFPSLGILFRPLAELGY